MTENIITINNILLVLMLMSGIWTVMGRSLLKATIGLAITSAIITMLMFRLNSPLAAVFELSVCTGLITVVFVSTISLTKPLTHKDIVEMTKSRHKRFGYLPIILIICAIAMTLLKISNKVSVIYNADTNVTVNQILWNTRQLDLFGQILIMIIGALGVVILFEERKRDDW